MHLARRGYVLVILTAVLAVIGIWAEERSAAPVWRLPLALLLLGIAYEGLYVRRVRLEVQLATAARAFLGRPQEAAMVIMNAAGRALAVEYAPAMPAGFAPLTEVRRVEAPARAAVRDPFTLTPVRLGPQSWPQLPARVRGPLGLAWWTRVLQPAERVIVAPDTLQHHVRPRGLAGGARPRRLAGAGAELFQLRGYVPGDPLSRIDWKATARAGELITRDFSEDQHLDILVAVDAGRFSRVHAAQLDRFGVYANLAARFAELATANDDRVGLVVYAERVLAACAPARGLPAVTRVRRTLEQLAARSAESDPTTAAILVRSMLKHRGLVVLLTDLDDASVADQLVRAVRLLSPPHLAVVAGVRSTEISALAHEPARAAPDPWVALAAAEHEGRVATQRALLQRLGAPLVVAAPQALEGAVFAEYEGLRRRRRV